jgi:3D (Asp-Asp-Asp) domain-containing protein
MSGFKRKRSLEWTSIWAICFITACALLEKQPRKVIMCVATAYAIEGVTASGEDVRKGMVAVDPSVIPLGSRVRITDAGKYSGVYLAADTGRNIVGHRIDIYMESSEEAKEFGRREVKVAILE